MVKCHRKSKEKRAREIIDIIRAVKAKFDIFPTKSMAIIKILIVLIIPKTAEKPRLSIYNPFNVYVE
tara:strand:- start:97 stop:297 length:201 start_codon:yes stop_codon:yes gene_type:complete